MTAVDAQFSKPPAHRLFRPVATPAVDFPIQSVRIDWKRLIAKRPCRPSKAALQHSSKCYVLIPDLVLQDRVQSYIATEHFEQKEHLFSDGLSNRELAYPSNRGAGREAPFRITSHTFRRSFAIHLLLHGQTTQYQQPVVGSQVDRKYRNLYRCTSHRWGVF